MAFYVVYIEEAHPTDLWQMSSNVRDGVLFASPRNDGERSATASACVRNLGIKIPAPDRLYLIGRNGRVLFKSRPGPYGFSSKGLEQALSKLPTP